MNRARAWGLALIFMLVALPSFAQSPQLPADLKWQTNNTDPIFADPSAKRGGRFRESLGAFPPTLRWVGPDSNSSFMGVLTSNMLSLVSMHPNTRNWIPELATAWAFDSDGKTIYFKLDPDARWSDGVPVTADDYLFTLEFMRSKFIVAPFYNDYYTNIIADIVKFDDYTIAVRAVAAKPPYEMLGDLAIAPTPRHFHKLDEHWVENYNWLIEPNTGPYQIDSFSKGKYIELKRKVNWWANDKRYFKYRFNPDYVRLKVIRDPNVAYNYFSKGELDSFMLILPRLWYKKAQGKIFDAGYVGKIKFYNEVPQPSQGLYLNQEDPILSDRNVRLGIAYSINFDKVIKVVLHNDYERLQTGNDGYGDYSNRDIHPRPFDLALADQAFNKAGWTTRGPDGVRIKSGQRLSLNISYGSDEYTARLAVLKEEALKAGLDLELQLLDASAWYKQVMEKKHQIAFMAWSAGGIAPDFWQGYASENAHKAQTNNVTNTADPAIDAKITAYRAATDKESRVKLAHELDQMVFDTAAYVPGYKVPYFREAFWRWIKMPAGYAVRSSEDMADPFGSNGGLFWIDEAEKDSVQAARLSGKTFAPINIQDEHWRVKP